jgi:hypothetical protein
MIHTLITFTPLQDTREDGDRRLPNCVPLTQTLGPIPLASLDANGWVIWEQKLLLAEGNKLLLAPIVGDVVQAPSHCFDLLNRANAIQLNISKDTQNPALFYLTLSPAGATPLNPLHNKAQLRVSQANNLPVPQLQIISTRDKYLTNTQTFSLDFIGTLDTRPGRNARLVFGNSLIVWADSNAIQVEWSSL